MKTLKEMLAEARPWCPSRARPRSRSGSTRASPSSSSTCAIPTSTATASSSPPPTSAGASSSSASAARPPSRRRPIVLYCQSGLRSMLAAKALKDLGYENVTNLQGGFQKWAQSGLPVVKDRPLQAEQIQRYSRHFLLSQVGEKGQRKLLRSKVLLIGAGGLGSPTAMYLAAAGRGHHRPHGRRRGGRLEPPAPDPPHHRERGPAQGGVGHRDDPGAQPGRERDPAAHAHRRRQRDGHHQGLRPGGRRLGQLRHPLPGQRRLLPRGQDQRPRLDLPVRGHGHRARPEPGARAIAASIRRRHRRASSPAEARPASWACSQASSAWCRPPRPSSSSSASAIL